MDVEEYANAVVTATMSFEVYASLMEVFDKLLHGREVTPKEVEQLKTIKFTRTR